MAAPQPTSMVAVDAGLSASAAKKRRARVKRNCWLTALLVVEFDVDTGHKPLFCLPAGSVRVHDKAFVLGVRLASICAPGATWPASACSVSVPFL